MFDELKTCKPEELQEYAETNSRVMNANYSFKFRRRK